MHKEIARLAEEDRANRRRRRRWRDFAVGLTAAAVLCGTWSALLPAITLENAPICGLDEHTHDAACYSTAGTETQLTDPDEPICGKEEHLHDAELCYAAAESIYCGQEEHIHGDGSTCIWKDGACVLPEHIHTEECLIEPTVYCGYTAHRHGASCYDENGELICVLPEHIHIEECLIEPTVYCGYTAHRHGASCYDENGELICVLPEHIHIEECLIEPTVYCGYTAHRHGASCYDENGELICVLPEHMHTEECLTQPELLNDLVGEQAVGTNWMTLRDSGWFEEYSGAAYGGRMLRSAVDSPALLSADAEETESTQQPSDVQVDGLGGSNSSEDGKVSVSKTIAGTELENVFDITLTVTTQEEITQVYKEPDMAVVIVMDISQTMNSDFGDTTRYAAAMTAAEAFLDQFAANTGGVSKIGYVAFNTNAHQIFGLASCSTESEADALKNTMRTKTGTIINAEGYADSRTRFTNVEAGLKMGWDMLKDAANENKYIIFLSDGFPTTYISSQYTGYDPYTNSGTVGQKGVFYDSVRDVYCNYGTSYSDTAAIKAREMAATIKNAGGKIFSIGVDVGGQTIQQYIEGGFTYNGVKQYESDGTPLWKNFSVVECPEGTLIEDGANVTYDVAFEIGDAASESSYKNWLKNNIGSGYYYDSTDETALKAAYQQIFDTIKELHEAASSAEWVAEDPLPAMSTDTTTVEFIGFYDQTPELVAAQLTGSGKENGENTAAFLTDGAKINWDLKNSGYTLSGSGNTTTYTYRLVYRVRLQNEADGFVEGTVYPTNDTTTLTYKLFESTNGETTVSEQKTLEFPIPSVHGYLGELTFQKTNPFGRAVSGAEFTLSHDTVNCSVCRGDGSTSVSVNDYIAVSDANGTVVFSGIPSGHQYLLAETKVPDGYSVNGNTYSVTVAYDVVTVTVLDSNQQPVSWDGQIVNNTTYLLPKTGGTGTMPYTMGGFLLIITAMLLLQKRCRKGAGNTH